MMIFNKIKIDEIKCNPAIKAKNETSFTAAAPCFTGK